MVLWRISAFYSLNGEGGLLYSARWHTAGVPVVYLAESPAGALLEICANTAAGNIPASFTLLKVVGPDLSPAKIALEQLPPAWVTELAVTRRIGTAWLQQRHSTLLQVPSALVPETASFLFNPLHPDSTLFQIERSYAYPVRSAAEGLTVAKFGSRFLRKTRDEFGFLTGNFAEAQFRTSYPQERPLRLLTLPFPPLSVVIDGLFSWPR